MSVNENMITTAKGKDMKTQIGIGHDVINDYNIGCLCCGRKDIQLHHYPSKGAMKGIVLSEILYVTIFPLCEVHHAEAHLGRVTVTEYLGGIRSGEAVMRVMRWEDFVESDLMKTHSKEITVREATIEHVKRIIAQNAKPSTE